MVYETIRCELTDGVATVTLDRPDVLNAMNQAMRGELVRCFAGLGDDDDVRAIVVTGAGERAFSAGADIREVVEPQIPLPFPAPRRRLDFPPAMDRCAPPILAAIPRHAPGGGPQRAPVAPRYAKEAVVKGLELPLAGGLRLENDLATLLRTTEDRLEGARAFLDKRKPRWTGR